MIGDDLRGSRQTARGETVTVKCTVLGKGISQHCLDSFDVVGSAADLIYIFNIMLPMMGYGPYS